MGDELLHPDEMANSPLSSSSSLMAENAFRKGKTKDKNDKKRKKKEKERKKKEKKRKKKEKQRLKKEKKKNKKDKGGMCVFFLSWIAHHNFTLQSQLICQFKLSKTKKKLVLLIFRRFWN